MSIERKIKIVRNAAGIGFILTAGLIPGCGGGSASVEATHTPTAAATPKPTEKPTVTADTVEQQISQAAKTAVADALAKPKGTERLTVVGTATAAATAAATATPRPTETPVIRSEQHQFVDTELKNKQTATLTAEFFKDGKMAVNKGDSVITFRNGRVTVRRVVTYDNDKYTGQATVIASDGSVQEIDVYSEWGSDFTSQIESGNLASFVEHNVGLMKQRGCVGEALGGCSKGVRVTIVEVKNGQVTVLEDVTADQIKTFAESRRK